MAGTIRVAIATLVAGLAIGYAAPAQEAGPPAAELRELVATLTGVDSDGAARAEALDRLRGVPPDRLTALFRGAVRAEATRSHALRAAAELRVPGLFPSVRGYLETADRDHVAELLLATQDRGATRFLFEHWKRGAADILLFDVLTRAFRRWPVDLDTLDLFRKVLDGPDLSRGTDVHGRSVEVYMHSAAARMLSMQLGLQPALAPNVIRKRWPELRAAHELQLKAHRVRGVNLLPRVGLGRDHWPLASGNLRLAAGADVELPGAPEDEAERGKIWHLPPWINWEPFTLRVWVLVPRDGEGAGVAGRSEQGRWAVEVRQGDWELRTGEATRYTRPWFPDDWSEIKFVVTPKPGAAKFARSIVIEVNGAVVDRTADLQFNGWIQSFIVTAGVKPIVIGAVDLERRQ